MRARPPPPPHQAPIKGVDRLGVLTIKGVKGSDSWTGSSFDDMQANREDRELEELLAKAYAREALRHVDEAVCDLCPGCSRDLDSDRDSLETHDGSDDDDEEHDLCLASPDKRVTASFEIVTQLVDTEAVARDLEVLAAATARSLPPCFADTDYWLAFLFDPHEPPEPSVPGVDFERLRAKTLAYMKKGAAKEGGELQSDGVPFVQSPPSSPPPQLRRARSVPASTSRYTQHSVLRSGARRRIECDCEHDDDE